MLLVLAVAVCLVAGSRHPGMDVFLSGVPQHRITRAQGPIAAMTNAPASVVCLFVCLFVCLSSILLLLLYH
jgi:hypothetical protein